MASHSVGQKAALLPCTRPYEWPTDFPCTRDCCDEGVVVVVENVCGVCVLWVWCTIDRGWIGAVHTISLCFLHVFDWFFWSCFYFILTVTMVIYLGATEYLFCIVRMETSPWRASVILWVVIAAGALYTICLFVCLCASESSYVVGRKKPWGVMGRVTLEGECWLKEVSHPCDFGVGLGHVALWAFPTPQIVQPFDRHMEFLVQSMIANHKDKPFDLMLEM